jgi:D-glycero-alpha-D-manno-heptose 1-phosphate guanylyltransferase
LEVIILAGGLGTRLLGIVNDVPKPMADINGRPFLAYLVEYVSKYGADKIIFSVGYKHEKILEYFGTGRGDIAFEYVIEPTLLGTGGAIREALKYARGENIMVLNGDTFFGVDLGRMINFHDAHASLLTIAVKPMHNFDRYGNVRMEGEIITGFEEKKILESGYINGGAYIIKKSLSGSFRFPDGAFSFETDYLAANIKKMRPLAFISDAYFVDIGIPEDYRKAREDFITLFRGD